MPFIPVSYAPQTIQNDITLARNLANLALAENFKVTMVDDVAAPFDDEQPESLINVRISVSFIAEKMQTQLVL